jgi:hypothetical protein
MNGKVVFFEDAETAEAREKAEEHLGQCRGFVLLTWSEDGVPVMNAGGITRADLAYMACYLSAAAISPEFNSELDS